MDTNQVMYELRNLIQLDIDAIRAYDQAIDSIDVASVKRRLERFREDHRRHVTNLSEIIQNLGGKPPENAPDLKGFLIHGFTAIRSVTGTEGALKAMETNEKLTASSYKQAVEMKFPADIHHVVEMNYRDEERHMSWIQDAVKRRVWTEVPAHP